MSSTCWSLSLYTPEAQRHVATLSPAIRHRLAIDLMVAKEWLPAMQAVANVFGFRNLSIVAKNVPAETLPAALKQLATGLTAAATAALRAAGLLSLTYATDDLHTDTSFAGVTSVRLIRCHGLTDLTVLAGAAHVDLFCCDVLTDVSALDNARWIHLHDCPRLVDVSALGRARKLQLSCCPKVQDVSALGNVQVELILRRCPAISDVSALGDVHWLTLDECEGVEDVSALGDLYGLDLIRCGPKDPVSGMHVLCGIGCLGRVESLTLSAVSVLPIDLEALGTMLDRLTICDNRKSSNVTVLSSGWQGPFVPIWLQNMKSSQCFERSESASFSWFELL